MTFEQLLIAYKAYLRTLNPDKPTWASSYGSYLKSVYTRVPGAQPLLDAVAASPNPEEQAEACEQVLAILARAVAYEADPKEKKKLQNGRTATVKLSMFLEAVKGGSFVPTSAWKKCPTVSTKKAARTSVHPFPMVSVGEDRPTAHVRYADNVRPYEQVPGLCSFLEEEYLGVIQFAKEIFGCCFKGAVPSQIPVVLHKECRQKVWENEDAYITYKVNALVAKGETVSLDEMQRILRIVMGIGGEFRQTPQPHIVLYYRQFDMSCRADYYAALAKTLAHEFTHYLEYAYCKMQKATPFLDARVSEAIADFFGVLYAVKKGNPPDLAVAERRYQAWVDYFGSSWPYAHALYFYLPKDRTGCFPCELSYYQTCGSIQKLQTVFLATPDAEDAYRQLIG